MTGSENLRDHDMCSEIVEYYFQTDQTYRHWGNAGAYELHYGYYDLKAPRPWTATHHLEALTRMNEKVAEAGAVTEEDLAQVPQFAMSDLMFSMT